MADFKTLTTVARPTWCPGCGNFGIWNGLKRAIEKLGLDPKDIVIVGGVGCSGQIPNWVGTYGFHGLHGRALPEAQGIRLANTTLTVIAAGGDGDGYGEGTNHLVHACRRNVKITYLVHNNGVFGLTKGQASPTAPHGYVTRASPFGVHEHELNPLALMIASGASFVARSFAGDLDHLRDTICEAVRHPGFAIVDILQPCVTFNKLYTYDYFQKRIYKISADEKGRGKHDCTDKVAALTRSLEWGDAGIPIGILYKEVRPTFESELPQIKNAPIVAKDMTKIDIKTIVEKYY